MTMNSTQRVLGHSLLHLLAGSHRSRICSLRTAHFACARLLCSFVYLFTHSLWSSWERDSCLLIKCVDFIIFQPTVRWFHLQARENAPWVYISFGRRFRVYTSSCQGDHLAISVSLRLMNERPNFFGSWKTFCLNIWLLGFPDIDPRSCLVRISILSSIVHQFPSQWMEPS